MSYNSDCFFTLLRNNLTDMMQNLILITSSMTKNKNVLKLHDFSSELSAINILKMSVTVSSVTQFESTNNFVILENSDSEFMNFETSK